MGEIIKNWNDGGSLSVAYTGEGDGTAVFSSSQNGGETREMEVSFVDASRRVIVVRRVVQAAGQASVETYTRLAFIESTGEQYINLGYVVQEDDVIDMQYITTLQSSADKVLFGCQDDNGSIWFSIYSNTAYVRFGSNTSASVSNSRQKGKVSIQRGNVNVDGTKGTLTLDGMPQVPLYLFARNADNSSVHFKGYFRTTGGKISKQDGTIVMDLKPYKRDSDDKVGLLDLVSGKFFANQGDGADFAYGGEAHITEDYEIIDYVSFNNDKIFDTGYYGNERTYIELLFQRTDTSGADYIFGTSSGNRMTGYLTQSGYWRYGSGYPTFNTKNEQMNWAFVTPTQTEVSGNTKSFNFGNPFTTAFTIPVGGHKPSSGVATATYQGYLFYFRIKIDDSYVVDWLPCRRKSDGVEGFWDCVTQTFVEPM